MKYPALWFIAVTTFGSWPVAAEEGGLDAGKTSIQEIIAALEANDLSANEIRLIGSYTHLDVVDLNAFEVNDKDKALETALNRTDDGWAMVQSAIDANDVIKEGLLRRSVAVRRIVAATMDEANKITIYIR